jgi:flagellar biosynthesis component FlhA
LLAEGVSIRPLREILEAIPSAPVPDSDDALLARVRRGLGRPLTHALLHEGALYARPVDPLIEEAVRESLVEGGTPSLAPDLVQDIVAAVRRAREEQPYGVLLTQPDVRLGLRRLLAPDLPNVPILSYLELDPDIPVERLEVLAP